MLLRIILLSMTLIVLSVHAHAQQVPRVTATAPVGEIQGRLVPEPVFGGEAYIIEAGKGHPVSVLLVHGMGDRAARDWETVIPVLARQYHVVAFDLPGFGRSTKGNHLYSPSRYAAFIEWVAVHYAAKPFVLIGHSMGGAISLRYASLYPDSLSRLILVDAAGILHHLVLTEELYALNYGNPVGQVLPMTEGGNTVVRSVLDSVAGMLKTGGPQQLAPALQSASLREAVFDGDPKKIAGTAMMLEDFGAAVSAVRTPTVLIWGANDRIAPLRTGKALAGRLPDARLTIIPEAGHAPMIDRPDLFNQILLEGLADRSPAAVPTVPAREPAPDRSVQYVKKKGLVLTGSYSRIELDRCSDVRIIDAAAEQIVVDNSNVTMENVVITGKESGLLATKAKITGTSVRIEADTAIHASHSRLDLAGASLIGRKKLVETDSSAVLIFSISEAKSPHYTGPLHGYRKISTRQPF